MEECSVNKTIITVRDYILPARIGIYEQEHKIHQPVRINLDMILESYHVQHDKIEDTVSYEGVVEEIGRLCSVHHELVEKLAEDIAAYCLKDHRVLIADVHVEKLEIFDNCVVGAKIIRRRPL